MKGNKKDYSDTLEKIENLKKSFIELELNIYAQISKGVTDEYKVHKDKLFNWLQEIEFDLLDNIRNSKK